VTLKLYIGTADEITARLAGAPDATTTTVATATSASVFTLTSATSFSAGDSIVIGKEKGVIDTLVGVTVTLKQALSATPAVGATVKHYDADYTRYRNQSRPFTLADDRKTGGNTGEVLGQDLIFFDYSGLMPDIYEQNRITVFESIDSTDPLFAGVITSSERIMRTKDGSTNYYEWMIEAKGHQWEADSVGIEEQPFTNVNAGDFLEYLRAKWTNLTVGEIDTTNSPTIDYIRLSNFRRFSQVGTDLAALWPGSEFYIKNTHTGGAVYFRQAVSSNAPITLNQAYLNRIGDRQDQYVRVRKDYEKSYNVVMLPYYKEQRREPDFHVQTTTANEAFLKTSVTLAGQPSSLEESILLFDDFADGSLDTDYTEDDLTNASPPAGFNSADGYLVEGSVNQVDGLHMLDTSGAGTVRLGDIGRVTDPAEVEPFTGAERQTILAKELVVNTLGDAVVLGISDLTSIQATTISGSTTTRVYVSSTADFAVDDRITVGNEKGYIQTIGANYFDLYSALTGAPDAGVTVSKHRLAKSRIKFGVLFKSTGDLKYIQDGVETAFATPRVYTAGPSTYSLRLSMQSFETTISGGISTTGCTLADATNFATGDVVEIFTAGSRSAPEKRVITVSGSDITYSATSNTPAAGYRVRTLPKIVLQIKGGSEYGDITGRAWTTIHTATNTWQTSASTDRDDHAVIVCLAKSLVATLSLFQMKDPIAITGNIGSRYLHIGTQDIDSSEADTDCIIRKVGSHFQLDFFPDTKALWSSGSTLELRYTERWRLHLESKDMDSIRAMAKVRGYTITESTTEQQAIRMGGRALDTLEIMPTPLTDSEAISQSAAILQAVKDPASSVEILTNTVLDSLCKAGQTLPSELTGVPNMEIQRVETQEMPGVRKDDGSSVYRQRIIAGTVDRLSEILKKRALANGNRLVIDDGVNDDSYTKIQKTDFVDSATTSDTFAMSECTAPSDVVYTGTEYALIRCLRIIPATSALPGGMLFDDPGNMVWM
jgi:hypothetical protein